MAWATPARLCGSNARPVFPCTSASARCGSGIVATGACRPAAPRSRPGRRLRGTPRTIHNVETRVGRGDVLLITDKVDAVGRPAAWMAACDAGPSRWRTMYRRKNQSAAIVARADLSRQVEDRQIPFSVCSEALGPRRPRLWEASICGAGRWLSSATCRMMTGLQTTRSGNGNGEAASAGFARQCRQNELCSEKPSVQETHAFRFRPDHGAGMNDQWQSGPGGRQGIRNKDRLVEINHIRLPFAFEMGQRCQSPEALSRHGMSADATAYPLRRSWSPPWRGVGRGKCFPVLLRTALRAATCGEGRNISTFGGKLDNNPAKLIVPRRRCWCGWRTVFSCSHVPKPRTCNSRDVPCSAKRANMPSCTLGEPGKHGRVGGHSFEGARNLSGIVRQQAAFI